MLTKPANAKGSGAALAVVQGNTKALAFYVAMGGVEVGSFIDAGPIWKLDNLVIAWEVNS